LPQSAHSAKKILIKGLLYLKGICVLRYATFAKAPAGKHLALSVKINPDPLK
jgi:hypothetical protein